MRESLFLEVKIDGTPFDFLYNQTLVVGRLFYKKMEWGPFRKVGQLSEEGILFVKNLLSERVAEYFVHNM